MVKGFTKNSLLDSAVGHTDVNPVYFCCFPLALSIYTEKGINPRTTVKNLSEQFN